MRRDFQRVAIINRGEPAMRLIHAVREYNHAHGTSLRTIALFTEPDRHALFVREADEAFGLGPATFVDPRDGERKTSYLDYERLEAALTATAAEAVWVGWGFVAEHAAFVDLCDRLGIVFIGPSGNVMRRLGDKITAKRLAEEADVPVALWSGGPVETRDAVREHAERLGLPLMIKATAGGGGRGIRIVREMTELDGAFESARSEALKAFGDATVFMERLIQGARHVEVQIVGDGQGTIWALGVRDCTLQRRHQKILEESPAPILTSEQDRSLRAAAVRLGQAVGYQNAGTVEFLYEPESQTFSFMEVNARLQVEHPVTEMTTGADLVKLQLHVARGGRLDGDPPPSRGHAIEVRLNAEDPDNRFAPAPGLVALFRMPTGPGVRIDTGVEEGDAIAPEFDSMIAKLVAYGPNRQEAMARLRRALCESSVAIEGGMSNKGFLLDLLNRPEVTAGTYDVGWVDRLTATGNHSSARHAEIALLHAAIEMYKTELDVEKAQFYSASARGRPEVQDTVGRTIELGVQGTTYTLDVARLGPDHFLIEHEGRRIDVWIQHLGKMEQRLTCSGRSYRVTSIAQGLTYLVEVNGIPHRITRDEGGVVRAPAPSIVVRIPVAAGDAVDVGDPVAVLEAMKMEMTVVAAFAGTVREVHVRSNVQVSHGAPLLVIEPRARALRARQDTVLNLDALGLPTEDDDLRLRCTRTFDAVVSLMLGYDINGGRLPRLVGEHGMLCAELPPDDRAMWHKEKAILNIFVDTSALFRRRSEFDDDEGDRLGTEAYLFTYLRDLDAQGASLPASFVEKIERVVAHYGIRRLTRTPALEESLFRIHKAHQRVDQQIGFILSILQRRLEHIDALQPLAEADPTFHTLLDRLIGSTQGRFPALNDLAREVRYRYFAQPMLEAVREQIYDEMKAHLTYLAEHPDADDRDERIKVLVACPMPLKSLLTSRVQTAAPPLRRLMLDVMMRRYYRIRDLDLLPPLTVGNHDFARAVYDHDNTRIHVLTTYVPFDRFNEAAEAVCRLIADVPAAHDVVVDFYAWRDGPLDEPNVARDALLDVINRTAFPRPLRRIVVAISGPESGLSIGGVQHFTFRPGDAGYREETFYRGLHPMMAKRLHLWRLQNFDLERLPSAEDVYLLRGVAKDNPKDERLFGIAEVRDLTPVRDASGHVVQLPQLERMLMEVVAGFRHVQAQRSERQRLHWNRILLYIWPPFDLQPDEIHDLANKLAPALAGLGLETVILHTRIPQPQTGALEPTTIYISNVAGSGMVVAYRTPSTKPLEPLDEYTQKVVRLRSRGLLYPYELIKMFTPSRNGATADFPPATFQEYDLDDDNALVPVERPYGQNTANVVVGTITHYTQKVPEGMTRVILLSDPTRGMGNVAEAECRRLIEGINLAERQGIPVEWFAVSAGARIAMDSGTENMDWIGAVLRRLIEFTQAGGEVNIIDIGINVGAQPYWNAEATMLMHTRGILIMTADAAMVLTGKQALDYSGGVSAEDNLGIGGYERIMGPNGQAQYFAHDVSEACRILLHYYDHTYVVPGERFPRRAATTDAPDRDVRLSPHGRVDGVTFATIGEVFSDEKNPGRKKPFAIRKMMQATIDQDHAPLERWFAWHDAEIGVVWDAHLGGYPVCLIGLESRPVPRLGFVPAYGPDQWTSGTLFPQSSRKIARAINAASGNRPLVVLANLSGFDGSPESMRNWQLEYGAEIGRAVVNFKGPIVFCVVSRYHGGAFVVFSNALNENMEIVALEGTYASVIGGAPAAAVVFAREVRQRTQNDPRLMALQEELAAAQNTEKVKLITRQKELYATIYAEKLGEVADEFDAIHSVYRAQQVGSVHRIIPPADLRPYLIDAIERGMRNVLDEGSAKGHEGRIYT